MRATRHTGRNGRDHQHSVRGSGDAGDTHGLLVIELESGGAARNFPLVPGQPPCYQTATQ